MKTILTSLGLTAGLLFVAAPAAQAATVSEPHCNCNVKHQSFLTPTLTHMMGTLTLTL